VEVAGAGVVAQALPELEHGLFGGVGQVCDGGESGDEALVVGQALVHAGLLENDFGEPDAV